MRQLQEELARLRARVKKQAARSSVTVPDPTADEGFREVVARSTD
jgi:hypothetical protein